MGSGLTINWRTSWEIRGLAGSHLIGLGDIDSDGELEIIIDDGLGNIILINAKNGTIEKKDHILMGRLNDIVVDDIDDDGVNEIILLVEPDKLIIYDILQGLNMIKLPSIPIKAFVFSASNNSKQKEIIVVDVSASLILISGMRIISRISVSKPIYTIKKFDINADGDEEYVVLHGNKLSVFKVTSNRMELVAEKDLLTIPDRILFDDSSEGIPKLILSSGKNLYIYENVLADAYKCLKFIDKIKYFSLYDIDRDGNKEILVLLETSSDESQLYILDLNGRVRFLRNISMSLSKMLFADVDGDGSHEIILLSGMLDKLFILDLNSLESHEVKVEHSLLNIILSDIDGDNKDEIILRSLEKIWVLDAI